MDIRELGAFFGIATLRAAKPDGRIRASSSSNAMTAAQKVSAVPKDRNPCYPNEAAAPRTLA